jgi:protein-S-isoprenylcysteine O-methyltransferase Ste14
MITRIGGWLFRHRTVIPLPLAAAVLVSPTPPAVDTSGPLLGATLVAAGEGMRLWSVRHIGVISRTRSERLGPLVATGPFALVRNPLYLGNILLWIGFAVAARLLWLVPLFTAVLAFEYHAIVRWEERLLDSRLGESYRTYAAQVPRWLPGTVHRRNLRANDSMTASSSSRAHAVFSWRETLYSERGTLIAITIGLAAIWVKGWLRVW